MAGASIDAACAYIDVNDTLSPQSAASAGVELTNLLWINDILCHRAQRYVGAQLTFHYDRKQIILEQTDVAKGLEGQYVELFDYWDKSLEARWPS